MPQEAAVCGTGKLCTSKARGMQGFGKPQLIPTPAMLLRSGRVKLPTPCCSMEDAAAK